MPDWLAPFHAPKFTDEKFETAKAKYNAEHGYTITLPAFGDVVHVKRFGPMSNAEWKLYTGKIPAEEIPDVERSGAEIASLLAKGKGPVSTHRRPNGEEMATYRKNAKYQLPTDRLEEIIEYKQKKKNRFIAMMQSPTPKIVRSAGAVLTALDDTQDAVSTLACIGKIAVSVAGRTAAAALSGPLGWVIGASSFLQMINPYSRLKGRGGKALTGRGSKRDLHGLTDKNPFSKKARFASVKNLKKFRPGIANLIEAAQVTDNIFGIGISLGPIMGFAQDMVAGVVRELSGQKVVFKTTPSAAPNHVTVAQKALKGQALLHAIPWRSDTDMDITNMFSANLALQVVHPYLQDWNPLTEVDNLAACMIPAPRPTDALTLEIIEEAGLTLDQVCNWPQNGQPYISLGELQEATMAQATDNLRHFASTNPNSVTAFIGGQNAHDFALDAISSLEGDTKVSLEYPHTSRIVSIILDNGWCYPDDITNAQVTRFEEWVNVHEEMDTQPNSADISRYAHDFCGFAWTHSPDEYR